MGEALTAYQIYTFLPHERGAACAAAPLLCHILLFQHGDLCGVQVLQDAGFRIIGQGLIQLGLRDAAGAG